MKSRQDFLRRLYMLSEICNFKMNDYLLELYEKTLTPHGFDALCAVIDKLIVERKSNSPFPSVADIVQLIKPKMDPKLEAIEAANRVVQAVSKFGYMRGAEAKEFIGSLGWIAVERYGGWGALCENLNNSEIGFFRAQVRDLLVAHQARIEMGFTDPPKLPEVEKSNNLLNATRVALGKKEDVCLDE